MKIKAKDAEVGETYRTEQGNTIKIVKIATDEDGETQIKAKARKAGAEGWEDAVLPGHYPLIAKDEDADSPAASDDEDEKPAKKGAKKEKAAKPAKKEGKPKKGTGAYQKMLAYVKGWQKHSVGEILKRLKAAKTESPKPPKLPMKWFVIEMLISKSQTTADMITAVRKAYGLKESQAKNVVYRQLFHEGKRVRRIEGKEQGTPLRYQYVTKG